MKIEYAKVNDRDELLAFLLTVFRGNNPKHAPFEDIYPDLFLPDDKILGRHAMIRENGKIVACVGTYLMLMQNSGRRVLTAGVGQVATLPEARGKGYMSALLNCELDRCRAEGAAFAWLGGRRDRYAHFGFDCAGFNVDYHCDSSSLRNVVRRRNVTCVDAVAPDAISPEMFALRDKTCNSIIEPLDIYRLQMKRLGFKFEIYSAFLPGEQNPDAWAVVDTANNRIEDWCGSVDGCLEILQEAAKKLGRVCRCECPSYEELSSALRNGSTYCGIYSSHLAVLNPVELLEKFSDFVPAGFSMPSGNDKCALVRALFGPGLHSAFIPQFIPGLFHV